MVCPEHFQRGCLKISRILISQAFYLIVEGSDQLPDFPLRVPDIHEAQKQSSYMFYHAGVGKR